MPKKIKLPRITWPIKPITRIKESEKIYNRKKEKQRIKKEIKKQLEEEA